VDWTGFQLVALPLALAALIMLAIYPRRGRPRFRRRPAWQYLLIWPLIRDTQARFADASGRLPRAYEIIGWALVSVLMALAIMFAQ
jgi:hypothetical protein